MDFNYWGFLISFIGLLMLIGGLTKTNFIIYRILAAKSKILWGKNVHYFYQVSGLLVMIFGVLVATKNI